MKSSQFLISFLLPDSCRTMWVLTTLADSEYFKDSTLRFANIVDVSVWLRPGKTYRLGRLESMH